MPTAAPQSRSDMHDKRFPASQAHRLDDPARKVWLSQIGRAHLCTLVPDTTLFRSGYERCQLRRRKVGATCTTNGFLRPRRIGSTILRAKCGFLRSEEHTSAPSSPTRRSSDLGMKDANCGAAK